MNELSFVLLARWALVSLGLVYFVTESAIFMHVRVWIARRGAWPMLFMYCAACVGFWVGAASAEWLWPFDFYDGVRWLRHLECGVATMALGGLWKVFSGGNPAYTVEAELLSDDTQAKEEESHDDEG